MRNARMRLRRVLLASAIIRHWIAILCLAIPLGGCTSPSPVSRLVQAHGFDQWDEVQQIEFTFNVEKQDLQISRSWRWSPSTNVVTYRNPKSGREISYDRDHLEDADDDITKVDAWLVNDSFWY